MAAFAGGWWSYLLVLVDGCANGRLLWLWLVVLMDGGGWRCVWFAAGGAGLAAELTARWTQVVHHISSNLCTIKFGWSAPSSAAAVRQLKVVYLYVRCLFR